MSIPNVHQLGTVPDFEGIDRRVERDYDALNVSAVTSPLFAGGVRKLEKLIAAYWTDLARWRAQSLDLDEYRIDLDDCRESLATMPGIGDPADFSSVDWHEVGERLKSLRPFGGYSELARLHALLTCDEPEAFRG